MIENRNQHHPQNKYYILSYLYLFFLSVDADADADADVDVNFHFHFHYLYHLDSVYKIIFYLLGSIAIFSLLSIVTSISILFFVHLG